MELQAHGDRLPISTLGITTCANPGYLQRCVESYGEHLLHHERQCDLIVADDSALPTHRKQNRSWLYSYSRRFGSEICYFGETEKRRFAQQLISLGISSRIVNFALFNPLRIPGSPGANRNALLLQCVGKAFVSCDDDSICLPADFRVGDQVAKFALSDWQIDTRFYANAQDALGSVVPAAEVDLLATHEQFLGRPLRDILPPACKGIKGHAGWKKRVDDDLRTGTGTVGVTLSGVVGDSGIPDARVFLFAFGHVRDRFLRSWMFDGRPEISRNVIRGVASPVITRTNTVWTTTATGFDNRVMLPPFLPSGRGEDTLFGIVLKKSSPDRYTSILPIGLVHLPSNERFYSPLPTSWRIADLLTSILEDFPEPHQVLSVRERLRLLGNYLKDCCADPREFGSHILRCAQRWYIRWLIAGNMRLKLFDGQPLNWAQTLEFWLDLLKTKLLESHVYWPTDFPSLHDVGPEGLHTLCSFVKDFGELLRAWPDIVDAALYLARKENALGSALTR